MGIDLRKKDFLFLLVCLGLGALAELSFFHGRIGISYLIFITAFYSVIFGRYQLSFNNRRIGLLLMACIWLLSGTYAFMDNSLFRHINMLLIPVLVFFHIVLITSPNNVNWSKPYFITILIGKLQQGIKYSSSFGRWCLQKLFKNMTDQTAQNVKRVVIGLAIGIPLLVFITSLLMSADAVFQDMVLHLPTFIVDWNFLEIVFRVLLAVVISLLFFGVFQVLHVPTKQKGINYSSENKSSFSWNSITAITILLLINLVYVLFVFIQFKYFFNDHLQTGYTYAEYARRGFFELIFVTLINWSILIGCLKLVKEDHRVMKKIVNVLYSILILVSGVMLASAYQRLSLYEAAYGYTMDRVLAHGFMVFLMVIFAYTFIRVWMERLSILHFYLIIGFVFYTGLNVIGLENIVVSNNLERYEQTGKIDVHYLSYLSYTGIDGLMDLYEIDPDYPELKQVLERQKQWIESQPERSWQSYNFIEQKVIQRMEDYDF